MSKGKGRQTQHRPERENARGKELADARREVKQLKRLVSRQQKTIERMSSERGIAVALAEASPEPALATVEVVIEKKDDDRCPHCGSNAIGTFTTPGGKKLTRCKNCKKAV